VNGARDLHAALGKSPAAAWDAGVAASGTPRLPADDSAFVLDFLPFEDRVVRREGVRLFSIHYFDGASAPLLERPNRKHREDAFFVQLLKAVDAPFDLSSRRHRLALRETTFRILRELETQVLVIDEINSLLVGTARQQRFVPAVAALPLE
jgi:hypothetical protein